MGRLATDPEKEVPDTFATVCRILSLKCNNHEQEHVADKDDVADWVFDRVELSEKSVANLKEICRLKSLPVLRTKPRLIERILLSDGAQSDRDRQAGAVLQLLLDNWFMTLFASSSSVREGTLNEAHVLSKVSSFVEKHSKYKIKEIKEYGLLCSKDSWFAAFSPDGSAVTKHDNWGVDVLALLEIKSKCSNATIQKEMDLVKRYGIFKSINASTNPLEFKQSVPDASHRCQLLYQMACGDLIHGFYVVASLSRIIRMVHVTIDDETIDCYHESLYDIYDKELSWVLNGEVPSLEGISLKHAVDVYTIGKTLDQEWRAINDLVLRRGRPLPPGQRLVPTIIAAWNRNKGPIDVFSCFMQNCHARHAHSPPLANIWLRLIMTQPSIQCISDLHSLSFGVVPIV